MKGYGFLATVLAAACVFFSGAYAQIPYGRPSLLQPLPAICGRTSARNARGSAEPDSTSRLLVRIGDDAAGALIAPRQVITLLSCIKRYNRPMPPGYYKFAVQFSGQQIPVASVQEQITYDHRLKLAVVTLAEHNMTKVSSELCVGPYNARLPSTAMTWSEKDGLPRQYAVTVHPYSHCSLYGVRDDYTLCTSPGPMMCGSPLVQVENGSLALIGLGTGNVGEVATYRHFGPNLKWLERRFVKFSSLWP